MGAKSSSIWWAPSCHSFPFIKVRIPISGTWMFHLTLRFFWVVCFSSPVPLVSRICPNDVCRIWKSGAKLRVDITLLGFENMSWIRGRRSFIFKGEGEWFCCSDHCSCSVTEWLWTIKTCSHSCVLSDPFWGIFWLFLLIIHLSILSYLST